MATTQTRKTDRKCRLSNKHFAALIHDPTKCPFCDGRIKARVHQIQRRNGHTHATAICLKCNRAWEETYLLASVKGIRK